MALQPDPLQLLIQQLKRLFPEKEGEAWMGTGASVLAHTSAGAIAGVINMPQAAKRTFVEREMRLAAAATRGGAGIGAGVEAGVGGGCQVDQGSAFRSEWILHGKGVVELNDNDKVTFRLRMLVDTGCTGREQDLVTSRRNAEKLGMKDYVCRGSRVAGTASIADNSKVSLVKQVPELQLAVPLYAPNSNEVLRMRVANLTVWVMDEKARTSDGGTAPNTERTAQQWMDDLEDLSDMEMVVGPHSSGYMFGGGDSSSSSGGTGGSSTSDDEDVSQDMYDSIGKDCQQLSPVSHDNPGNVIIGLTGLVKLGLRLDPEKRAVYSMRREDMLLPMKSI